MVEPVVQMLWEPDDPVATLRERFGFAGVEEASRWVARVLGDRYGVRLQACERIVMSDRNALAWVVTGQGRLIVKWCIDPARFGRLDGLAQLVADLGRAGLPVSAPVPGRDGKPQIEVDGVSVGVQRVIDGTLLDVEDDAAVREAGAVLARLHQHLAAVEPASVPGMRAPEQGPREQVAGWLRAAPSHLPADAVRRLEALLAVVPDQGEMAAGVQLVHGDFRSANVLCRGREVAAVLDFEEARVDLPVVELARSAVLLGTQFHDWGPVSERTRMMLRRGYESVRPLSPVEAAWWEVLVLWWSLMFVPDGADPQGWRDAASAQAAALPGAK